MESAALYRLMAWLSPAYPVGAFSYSGGIEWAVEAGDIKNAETLRAWLEVMLSDGGGFSDAVFFLHAHRAVAANNDPALRTVAELAAAFVPSKERFLETTAQGRAFLEVTRAAWSCAALTHFTDIWNGPIALPIAVGVACAGHGIPCETALHAFLHALRPTGFLLVCGSSRSARPTASACSPRWKRRSQIPQSARWRRRSKKSARAPCAPTSPACGTRPNTRDCFALECREISKKLASSGLHAWLPRQKAAHLHHLADIIDGRASSDADFGVRICSPAE